MIVDVHVIDELEDGEIFGAKIFVGVRAVVALVHVRIGAHGNEQRISLFLREGEVTDMPRVNDVEATVALHERLALVAQ